MIVPTDAKKRLICHTFTDCSKCPFFGKDGCRGVNATYREIELVFREANDYKKARNLLWILHRSSYEPEWEAEVIESYNENVGKKLYELRNHYYKDEIVIL